jgi:hypothetical protein
MGSPSVAAHRILQNACHASSSLIRATSATLSVRHSGDSKKWAAMVIIPDACSWYVLSRRELVVIYLGCF